MEIHNYYLGRVERVREDKEGTPVKIQDPPEHFLDLGTWNWRNLPSLSLSILRVSQVCCYSVSCFLDMVTHRGTTSRPGIISRRIQ